MKKVLILSLVLLFICSSVCWSDDWKEYYRDSIAAYSYRNIKKLSDDLREVETVMEIGYACVYNHYRINCKTKQWLQIERVALPCGQPFSWESGEGQWNNLDKKDVTYEEMKKLMGVVCKKASTTSVPSSNDVIVVNKFKDGWGETHSCICQKKNIERDGNIIEVQLDRKHPNGTVREWIKINCTTKKYSTGKIEHLKTGYIANFGYISWHDYDVATADPCTGKLIDLLCK